MKLSASLFLVPIKKEGLAEQPLGGPLTVTPAAAPFTARVALPKTAAGDYTVEIRLAADGETPAPAARPAFLKSLLVHIDTLGESVQQLRTHLSSTPHKDGIATAEYALALYERADASDLNPTRVNFREE